MDSRDVKVVFPSTRQLSPVVRAFVDILKHASTPGTSWQDDPLVPQTQCPKTGMLTCFMVLRSRGCRRHAWGDRRRTPVPRDRIDVLSCA